MSFMCKNVSVAIINLQKISKGLKAQLIIVAQVNHLDRIVPVPLIDNDAVD